MHQMMGELRDRYGMGLLMPPSRSYAEIGDRVVVRMSWGFRTEFPRSAVKAVSRYDARPISRGVHGFAGRWLVNGSGEGIVTIDLEPSQRGYVMGFPVNLTQLMVSIEQPEQFMGALSDARSEARVHGDRS